MGTTHWKKPTSGAWEDSANWSKGLPGRHDVAQIIADGDYTVTLSSKQKVAELDVSHATLIEAKGAALTTGKIVLDQATLQLDVANPHLKGEIDVTASTLEIGRNGALGSAVVALGAGAVLESGVTTTITGEIDLALQGQGDLAPTIMAATGKTLTIAGHFAQDGDGSSVIFGSGANQGEIDFGSDQSDGSFDVVVAGGTLKITTQAAADDIGALSISTGAVFDLGGIGFTPDSLDNNGTLTNSSSVNCTVDDSSGGITNNGEVTGNITLDIDVEANNGVNIELSNNLILSNGGGISLSADGGGGAAGLVVVTGQLQVDALGSIFIDDNCELVLETSATLACQVDILGSLTVSDPSSARIVMSGPLDGDGVLRVNGGGILELGDDDSNFLGTVLLSNGVIIVDDGASPVSFGGLSHCFIGLADTGVLSLGGESPTSVQIQFSTGGLLLDRATNSLNNNVFYGGSGNAIAAAPGQTATLAGAVNIEGDGISLLFGAAGDTGTVVLAQSEGYFKNGPDESQWSIEVAAGTLRVGNAVGEAVVLGASGLTIDTGATFDINGFDLTAALLTGGGTITTSAAGGSLTVSGISSLSGAITGGLLIDVAGSLTLSGPGSFATLAIEGGATATLSNGASEHVTMDGNAGATLALTDKATLKGSIEGFGLNDKLDLQGLAFQSGSTTASYDAASHHLTVTTGFRSVVLTLDGSYTSRAFKVSDDGGGHTLVSYQDIRGATPRTSSPAPHVFSHAATEPLAEWNHPASAIMPHDPHLAILV